MKIKTLCSLLAIFTSASLIAADGVAEKFKWDLLKSSSSGVVIEYEDIPQAGIAVANITFFGQPSDKEIRDLEIASDGAASHIGIKPDSRVFRDGKDIHGHDVYVTVAKIEHGKVHVATKCGWKHVDYPAFESDANIPVNEREITWFLSGTDRASIEEEVKAHGYKGDPDKIFMPAGVKK
jgi:hypothetical protein